MTLCCGSPRPTTTRERATSRPCRPTATSSLSSARSAASARASRSTRSGSRATSATSSPSCQTDPLCHHRPQRSGGARRGRRARAARLLGLPPPDRRRLLLGIGRDATATGRRPGPSCPCSTCPTRRHPRLQQVSIPGALGRQYDHHALAETGLAVLPVQSHGGEALLQRAGEPVPCPGPTESFNGAVGFHVATDGIDEVGRVTHDDGSASPGRSWSATPAHALSGSSLVASDLATLARRRPSPSQRRSTRPPLPRPLVPGAPIPLGERGVPGAGRPVKSASDRVDRAPSGQGGGMHRSGSSSRGRRATSGPPGARALLAAGHTVRCLARTPSNSTTCRGATTWRSSPAT